MPLRDVFVARAPRALPTPWFVATRALPVIYSAGPVLSWLWLLLQPDPVASLPLYLAASVAGLATAIAVRTRALDLRRPIILHGVLGGGVAAISLCIASSTGGGVGLGFFYLWTVPLAFALCSRRGAYGQVAWTGVLYAAALMAQDVHAGTGFPSDADATRLAFGLATTIALGELVRALARSLQASASVMAEAFGSAPVGMVVTRKARILAANDAFLRLIARRRTEVDGADLRSFLHPEDAEVIDDAFRRTLSAPGASVDVRHRFRRPDGSDVHVHVTSTTVSPDGSDTPLVFAQAVDVTAQHEAEAARDRALRRARALGALSRQAVSRPQPRDVMVDAAHLLAGELQASHVMVAELQPDGESLRFVAGTGWPEELSRSEIPATDTHAGMALEADGPVTLDDIRPELVPGSTPLHRQGLRSGVVAVIRQPGRPWGVIGVHSTRAAAFDAEATAYVDQVAEVIASAVQRAEAEEQAREQTQYDRLTGLPGRELLLRRLDDAVAEARAHDRRLGVLLIDLDDLRLVNEGYGHEAGDEVLRVVAARLRDLAADGVAGAGHIAGDELVLFWETATDEQVFAAAEDVLAAVRKPIEVADERLVMTASIGVAVAGAEERQPEVLLREADVALARAKQQGRARFEVYDELTHRRALERLRLQVDLRVALEQDELHLVYQPLVSLHDGRVCGVEALLRWQHLTRGLISPADFIPVAEASGLIVPIGLHVLRTACREAAAWAEAGTPVPVSVNVAVQQLARRGFAGDVQDALCGTGLAPSLLALEITETTLMEANDRVLLDELRAVRALGVAVHLDDFGTGYSSLGSLRDVPLDVVKVDRSFVSSLGSDPHSEPILQAITTMAHELGLRVVAEGVETVAQRDLVAELGCDEAQGYLFAAPSPAEAVAGLLDASAEPVAP